MQLQGLSLSILDIASLFYMPKHTMHIVISCKTSLCIQQNIQVPKTLIAWYSILASKPKKILNQLHITIRKKIHTSYYLNFAAIIVVHCMCNIVELMVNKLVFNQLSLEFFWMWVHLIDYNIPIVSSAQMTSKWSNRQEF